MSFIKYFLICFFVFVVDGLEYFLNGWEEYCYLMWSVHRYCRSRPQNLPVPISWLICLASRPETGVSQCIKLSNEGCRGDSISQSLPQAGPTPLSSSCQALTSSVLEPVLRINDNGKCYRQGRWCYPGFSKSTCLLNFAWHCCLFFLAPLPP